LIHAHKTISASVTWQQLRPRSASPHVHGDRGAADANQARLEAHYVADQHRCLNTTAIDGDRDQPQRKSAPGLDDFMPCTTAPA